MSFVINTYQNRTNGFPPTNKLATRANNRTLFNLAYSTEPLTQLNDN